MIYGNINNYNVYAFEVGIIEEANITNASILL